MQTPFCDAAVAKSSVMYCSSTVFYATPQLHPWDIQKNVKSICFELYAFANSALRKESCGVKNGGIIFFLHKCIGIFDQDCVQIHI
jgi:hypothetical protein